MVTSDFKVWSRGHSRILVDTNCVPGLSRKYSAYGSDHPLIIIICTDIVKFGQCVLLSPDHISAGGGEGKGGMGTRLTSLEV